MSRRSFTESADPAVERAVEQTLAVVLKHASRLADVESVLLGGSLGRGEGTVLDGSLRSDAELYLVGRSSRLRRAASVLEEEVNARGSTPEVSIAWVDPRRLEAGWAKNKSRRPSMTIHLFELAQTSRVLVGRRPVMFTIDPARIPLAEGIRLILNRMAEVAPLMASQHPDRGRWLDKILIACGDSLLLAAGEYVASYRDRQNRLATISPPWSVPDEWRAIIHSAYARKLSGQGDEVPVDRVAEVASAVLREAVERSMGFAVPSWADFPRQFARAAARDENYLRYLPPIGPAALYEGLILIMRVRREGLALRPRALGCALRGRPLSLAMQGAAAPLFLASPGVTGS